MLVLSLVGTIFSSLDSLSVMAVISDNTVNLLNDDSAVKVANIDYKDYIYLENGNRVSSDDIENYVKVFKGTGTWYISEGSCLVTEVIIGDIILLLKPLICYFVALVCSLICFKIYCVEYISKCRVLFTSICTVWIVALIVIIILYLS